ncbi:MAG TPA: CCA tRNA nucleotidyltransferase [Candidatus Koribacter sp.]|jgi:poly(A) polymerase
MSRSSAAHIVQILREHGHQAYFVGGCVRDLLLHRIPADYDVATDALPEQVMKIFPRTWAVGAQFGVVLVPIDNESCDAPESPHSQHHGCIEVATFRSDGLYSDGRHPDAVRFTRTAREDVQRRDFTINGMLLDPLNDEVLDYVNGRADLEAGIIRTIGEPHRRFAEDKLRMLRAIRFAARFNYSIDPATMAAIRELAPEIRAVSHERVRDELTKMLTEGHARRAFELLDESALLPEILPDVAKMKGVQQPPQFHPEGDVWVHTLLLLEKLPEKVSPTLAWGALLHDVGKPPTFRIAPERIRFDNHVEVGVRITEQLGRDLRFSNDDLHQITALVDNHMKWSEVTRMRESTIKRFMRQPKFDEHMALHRLDCLSSHGDLSLYDFVKGKMEQTPVAEIRPTPLLTGDDLITAGYRPGPLFKEILSAVEDAQLEARLQSREDAMEFVRREFPL